MALDSGVRYGCDLNSRRLRSLPLSEGRGFHLVSRLNLHSSRPILAGMAKKPEPPRQPTSWSGRIEARIGLRMMPTFPRSPLRFRTASFPQYGSKAGLSDRAFPDLISIKLAPSVLVTGSGLHPSFVLSAAAWILRSESEATCSVEHRHPSDMRRSTPGALAPVRVLLSRSIIT